MRIDVLLAAFGCGLLLGQPATAQQPLSAIDWLSQSVERPSAEGVIAGADSERRAEPPVTKESALPEDVAVSRLDAPSVDATGLLSSQVTGLPRDLWGMGLEAEVIAAIASTEIDLLPALQGLMMTILLAEAAPPIDSKGTGNLLLARVDRLLVMGALEQASALMEASGSTSADVFRRAFDVALLTGNEDRGCEMMRATPNLAPTLPARIFCLARSGDWNAAALTLRTAQALGHVDADEDALLSRFLDPDLYEGESIPPLPARMTPLSWRMFEAIGEPQGTETLPLAFAHAELRDTAGWKAQIEAAERLVRVGAIGPNVLLGLYTERLPAASGGVWDRVDAFQQFETALAAGDPGAVAQSLPPVWSHIMQAELEVPFALLFAQRLSRLPLTGEAAAIAFDVSLLSPDYEAAAKAHRPANPREAFLVALATGNLSGAVPQDSLGRAIAPAFLRPKATPDLTVLLDQNRMGEALLSAMSRISRGLEGNLQDVSDGLAFLRHAGFEDVARRTALQLILLERRG